MTPPLIRAVHDWNKTRRAHTRAGSEAQKLLRIGKSAHIFHDGIDLSQLEQQAWLGGSYQGRVGQGQRSIWERFLWQSPTPIGMRIQNGKPDVALSCVEIKGKLKNALWIYHLVPRARAASTCGSAR